MEKKNRLLRPHSTLSEVEYDFSQEPGSLLLATPTSSRFRVVKEFSGTAKAYQPETSLPQQDEHADWVYAEEVFEDQEDIYAATSHDTALEGVSHRKLDEIAKELDEAYAKNGYSGGLSLPLLSAMQFSRLILLPAGSTLTPDALERYLRTMGSHAFPFVAEGEESIAYAKAFLDAVSFAKANPQKPVFCYWDEAFTKGSFDYLHPFYPYLDNPKGDAYITAGGKSFSVPSNLYVMARFAAGEQLFDFSRRFLRFASILHVDLKAGEQNEKVTAPVSLEEIRVSVNEAADARALSEDAWKRIDALVSLIHGVNGYVMSNKIALRLENYCAALFSSYEEEDEILDLALSANVITEAIVTTDPLAYSGDADPFVTLENQFGEGKMTRTAAVIKAYLALFDREGKRHE